MLQTWHDLIFLHARVPKEVLQRLVPPELTVEEFDGSAWLGFVPFSMSGIRKPHWPAIPRLSSFHETNIRTYVTHPEFGPGVWFFSLDAAQYLACWYARQYFKLPYFHAMLSRQIDHYLWRYSGLRYTLQILPKTAVETAGLQSYEIKIYKDGDWHEANPQTFEYWLVERYRLYSQGKSDQLFTARVMHEPYKIAKANPLKIKIYGLEPQFGVLNFESVLVAKTLNVQCFSPQQVC